MNDAAILAQQLGRAPRAPWRVAARCSRGFPAVVVSPLVLSDGTPFPTFAWLSCPYLVAECGKREARGETHRYNERVASDTEFRERLLRAVEAFRALREAESVHAAADGGAHLAAGGGAASLGRTAGADTAIAGQSHDAHVKCLHAHVAVSLLGIADPVGGDVLGALAAQECADSRCGQSSNVR